MTTPTQTVLICGNAYQSREAYSPNSCNWCAAYNFGNASELCKNLPNCGADASRSSIIWVRVK